VQELIDLGQLDEVEAASHPMKNRITKALGIHSVIKPTILEVGIQVKAGACFLLCSDGLNGMINDSNIESILQTSNSIHSRANNFIQKALEVGGKDNVTLTLIEIIGSPYSESTFIPYIPPPKSKRRDDSASFNEEIRPSKPTFLQNTNWFRYLIVFIIIVKIIYLFLTMK
jgi:serine/threonine protein phosphatase PrpC